VIRPKGKAIKIRIGIKGKQARLKIPFKVKEAISEGPMTRMQKRNIKLHTALMFPRV
jgi:phage protein D